MIVDEIDAMGAIDESGIDWDERIIIDILDFIFNGITFCLTKLHKYPRKQFLKHFFTNEIKKMKQIVPVSVLSWLFPSVIKF